MTTWLQYGSAGFAALAAILWFWSAAVGIPKTFAIHVLRPDSFEGKMRGSRWAPEYTGVGHSDELDELAKALCWQSRLSAAAACAAGASALLQGVAIAVGT